MLSAIYFDDQAQLVTGEITKAPADCRLPAEMMRPEGRLTQMLPENVLCARCVLPQLARA
jgi:hypothetical protein